MASIIYNSFALDVFRGNCNTTHTFRAMLVNSSYVEDKTHDKRSAVSNFAVTFGVAVTLAAQISTTTDPPTLILTTTSVTFPTVNNPARKMIIYRHRGGAASADELVCCVDYGTNRTDTTQVWSATSWTITLPVAV
jgi:hypothetical protein